MKFTAVILSICVYIGSLPAQSVPMGASPHALAAATLTDNFTGTNGTLLSAHTSDSGNTWAQTFTTDWLQTAQLNGSGGVVPSASDNNIAGYISNWTPPSADYTVQATCTVSGTDVCGVLGRAVAGSEPNDYVAFFIAGTGVGLYKHVANSPTQLGTTYSGVTGGSHVITLVMVGTTISVKVDGTTQITATDSTYSSAGQAGIGLRNAGAISVLTAN
jgi:hypothetical protein